MTDKQIKFFDTPRARLIDRAAATFLERVQAGGCTLQAADSVVWAHIDESAQALGAADLDIEAYYVSLTKKGEELLIKNTRKRAREFLAYPPLLADETVLKVGALNRARGLLKIEGVSGWTIFAVDLNGESHVLPRHEVKRPYYLGHTVYTPKTGGYWRVTQTSDEGVLATPLGVQAAPRGLSYTEIEPTDNDGLTNDLYPVSLMRPFYDAQRGWILGHKIPVDFIVLEGHKTPLTNVHKAILSRLKTGVVSRAMLSVAAYNHPQMLASQQISDRWRRQELRQLIAGGLVAFTTWSYDDNRHLYELTAAGKLVADTLPAPRNPLHKKDASKERAAAVSISHLAHDDGDWITISRRGKGEGDWVAHHYFDNRLTASSRKRLMYLLWSNNWVYDRIGGGTDSITDYYELDPA